MEQPKKTTWPMAFLAVFTAMAVQIAVGTLLLRVEPAGGPMGSMIVGLSNLAYWALSFLIAGLGSLALAACRTGDARRNNYAILHFLAAVVLFVVMKLS